MLAKFSYVCGSVLSEYQGTGGELKTEREIFKSVCQGKSIMRIKDRTAILQRCLLQKDMCVVWCKWN